MKNQSDIEIEKCKCGALPEIRRVGDWKELFVVQCFNCGRVAAGQGEGKYNESEAVKLWNNRSR